MADSDSNLILRQNTENRDPKILIGTQREIKGPDRDPLLNRALPGGEGG